MSRFEVQVRELTQAERIRKVTKEVIEMQEVPIEPEPLKEKPVAVHQQEHQMEDDPTCDRVSENPNCQAQPQPTDYEMMLTQEYHQAMNESPEEFLALPGANPCEELEPEVVEVVEQTNAQKPDSVAQRQIVRLVEVEEETEFNYNICVHDRQTLTTYSCLTHISDALLPTLLKWLSKRKFECQETPQYLAMRVGDMFTFTLEPQKTSEKDLMEHLRRVKEERAEILRDQALFAFFTLNGQKNQSGLMARKVVDTPLALYWQRECKWVRGELRFKTEIKEGQCILSGHGVDY